MLISYKEWLSKDSPPSPNIWDYGTNAELQYFKKVRSKYTTSNKSGEEPKIDPEGTYFCSKKQKKKVSK